MRARVTETTAATIARSWPTMQSHRRDLATAIARYLARRNSHELRDGGSVALLIMDMLFDHARDMAGMVPLQRIEETGRRHRLEGIAADHYSSFGDGLGAAMKDVLGAKASPSLLSAWGDAYWTIVRSVSRQERPIAA